jgi:antagonist of KipI
VSALRVESAGLLTTIQDLGRPRHRFAGVPPGGALDRFALAAANLLVGNPEQAAGLECTVTGPVVTAEDALVVAVTGGDYRPLINGAEAPTWTSVQLAPGDTLDLRTRAGGARCYLAVAGGIAGQRWLGSVATYQLVGRGGLDGRALRAGDVLELAAPPGEHAAAGKRLDSTLRPSYEPELGAVPGPYRNRLTPDSRRRLYRQMFHVLHSSNRMGYRLDGEPLDIGGAELLSFGVAAGCIQVPPSGLPILLLQDHQTAGGYPVVAGVGRAWLPAAAQLLPGSELSFRQVTLDAAQAEWRRLRQGLETLRPRAAPPRG